MRAGSARRQALQCVSAVSTYVPPFLVRTSYALADLPGQSVCHRQRLDSSASAESATTQTWKSSSLHDIWFLPRPSAARGEVGARRWGTYARRAGARGGHPGSYAAGEIRFLSVAPSIGIRRGLTVSLSGSVNCSMPWR